MLTLLLFGATCLLAYANGANDNFKGVASLFGSDTTHYRGAIAWGTITTLAGSVASIFLAQALLQAFSGKGLVPAEVAAGQLFVLAVAVGAGGTVLLATLLGFPISTTHGLVGAIVGAGFLAAGSALNVHALLSTFVLPLVASPFMALALAAALYGMLHRARTRLGIRKEMCLCVGEPVRSVVPIAASAAFGGTAVLGGRGVGGFPGVALPIEVAVDTPARCEERYTGRVMGVTGQKLLDGAHFLSAGLVSFARGLNDTPKIAALLLVMGVTDIRWGWAAVGVAIAAGGLLSASRVAMTMGRKITGMNHGQGLAANLTTGFLVIVASRMGLPVSTTHVSVGSLFGIGLSTGQADLRVVRGVVLSWVITVPVAAALAALTYGVAMRLA